MMSEGKIFYTKCNTFDVIRSLDYIINFFWKRKGGTMKEEAKGRKQKALAFGGIIVGVIFALTLMGNLNTADARGGFRHFADAGKKWHKQYHKKHKKHIETISAKCGETIGPGGHYRLDADLDCSDFETTSNLDAALTVVGPVTLDLRGHSIIGNANLDGILVDGEKAKIRNGTVKDCFNGVVLEGEGHHKVFKMKAVDNEEWGFAVNSDYNRLTVNTASDNGDNGFYFIGNNNWFVKNRAENNGDEGFYGPSESGQNKIYMNRAIGNLQDGIQVVGNENRVIHNLAKENGYDTDGKVYKGGYDGFEIDGDRNFVYKNRSFNNSLSGFEVDGRENKILKNRAKQNMQNGIRVEDKPDTVDNLIYRNTLKENAEYDIFVEIPSTTKALSSCDSQTWKKNRFDTSNMDCIE